jgi:hypothetical protein
VFRKGADDDLDFETRDDFWSEGELGGACEEGRGLRAPEGGETAFALVDAGLLLYGFEDCFVLKFPVLVEIGRVGRRGEMVNTPPSPHHVPAQSQTQHPE